MKGYEDYEKACDEIQRANTQILEQFEGVIRSKGLTKRTIESHLGNIDLFLNDFLLREEPYQAAEGITRLDSFFYFFIHKCMWSTPGTVKTTATSLKKFYQFMRDSGKISAEDFAFVSGEIKENLPRWVEDCRKFNDEELDEDW